MCQVNPFGDAQHQNHVILLTLSRQVCITAGYIVALQQVIYREDKQNSEQQFHYIIGMSANSFQLHIQLTVWDQHYSTCNQGLNSVGAVGSWDSTRLA